MQPSNPAIDQLGTYRPRLDADVFAGLSKDRRDWLEVFGNTWGDTNKQMPGTCELCVWGRGKHSVECVTQANLFNAFESVNAEVWNALAKGSREFYINAFK